jgi:hypothetical protein
LPGGVVVLLGIDLGPGQVRDIHGMEQHSTIDQTLASALHMALVIPHRTQLRKELASSVDADLVDPIDPPTASAIRTSLLTLATLVPADSDTLTSSEASSIFLSMQRAAGQGLDKTRGRVSGSKTTSMSNLIKVEPSRRLAANTPCWSPRRAR